jgi:hypothetical protein
VTIGIHGAIPLVEGSPPPTVAGEAGSTGAKNAGKFCRKGRVKSGNKCDQLGRFARAQTAPEHDQTGDFRVDSAAAGKLAPEACQKR